MSWDYRIFAMPDEEEPDAFIYYICEAYYDKNNNIDSWAQNYQGMYRFNISMDELKDSYKKYGIAFQKPVVFLNKDKTKIIEEKFLS